MAQTELYHRGMEELRSGRFDEAIRSFAMDEQEAGEAERTAALLRQAEALLAKGELESSARLFQQVLKRNPSRVGVYLGLSRIALATEERDAARVHATVAVQLAPDHGLAWTLLALVQEDSGELGEALESAKTGAELSPELFLCQLAFGRMLLAAGQAGEAVAPLFRATRLEPLNVEALSLLGAGYRASGQRERAIGVLASAARLAPERVEGYAALGDTLFEGKAYRAARSALDRGLAKCGESPVLLEKALACAMMLADWAGAARYVRRELAIVPQHERGWLNLASLQLLTGEADKSEQTARELLARNPDCWEAWFHLGNLYEAVPLEAMAEEAYRRAVALAPCQWKPLMNLAALLVQLPAREKHLEAVGLLEQAAPLTPKDEWRVTYNLALARIKIGERDVALALAREVLARWPGNAEAQTQARVLEANLLEAR
jgi:tetratricopeptide (TPR) repeat protein